MGEPPLRVDILQVLSGIRFDDAWESRTYATVNGEFDAPMISVAKLVENKLAAARPQDLLDIAEIRRRSKLLERFK